MPSLHPPLESQDAGRAGARRFCAAGQPPATPYPLSRNAAEHDRLSAQAAFWQPDTRAWLDTVPIAPGQRVADLGCGTPHVAQALADRVGLRGEVLALDNDAGLAAGLHRAAQQCPAIVPCLGDAFATGWPTGSLDAVHARFLAAPTGRLEALVAEMARVLRPGGWLLLQEPVAADWQVPAAGAHWDRLKELILAGFARRGGEFDAGGRLVEALRGAGAAVAQVRRVRHLLPGRHPYARLPLAFGRSLAAVWHDTGLLAEPEQAPLLAAVEAALDTNAPASTFTLVQAVAQVG
jgi:ubiquinone/menaquinone biosynthesis C-methylase UbiE